MKPHLGSPAFQRPRFQRRLRCEECVCGGGQKGAMRGPLSRSKGGVLEGLGWPESLIHSLSQEILKQTIHRVHWERQTLQENQDQRGQVSPLFPPCFTTLSASQILETALGTSNGESVMLLQMHHVWGSWKPSAWSFQMVYPRREWLQALRKLERFKLAAPSASGSSFRSNAIVMCGLRNKREARHSSGHCIHLGFPPSKSI